MRETVHSSVEYTPQYFVHRSTPFHGPDVHATVQPEPRAPLPCPWAGGPQHRQQQRASAQRGVRNAETVFPGKCFVRTARRKKGLLNILPTHRTETRKSSSPWTSPERRTPEGGTHLAAATPGSRVRRFGLVCVCVFAPNDFSGISGVPPRTRRRTLRRSSAPPTRSLRDQNELRRRRQGTLKTVLAFRRKYVCTNITLILRPLPLWLCLCAWQSERDALCRLLCGRGSAI